MSSFPAYVLGHFTEEENGHLYLWHLPGSSSPCLSTHMATTSDLTYLLSGSLGWSWAFRAHFSICEFIPYFPFLDLYNWAWPLDQCKLYHSVNNLISIPPPHWPRRHYEQLAWSLEPSPRFCLPSAGITGRHHHDLILEHLVVCWSNSYSLFLDNKAIFQSRCS